MWALSLYTFINCLHIFAPSSVQKWNFWHHT